MIEMKAEVETKNCKINGEGMRVNLEVGPQKKLLSRALTMFHRGLKEPNGDKSKIGHAEYTFEGQRHAQEGWQVVSGS